MRKFNGRLKAAIKDSGRLQWWVAAQAGLSAFAMSQIVNGRQHPSRKEKRAIASALQVEQSAVF